MAQTRIINLTEASALQSDDYLVADSSRGTRKVQVENIIDETLAIEGKFADAKAVGDKATELTGLISAEAANRASADTTLGTRVTTTETDIASLKNDLTDTESATLATNASGNCWYVSVGKIVVVTGTIATSAAFAASSTIASGLPRCATNNGLVYAINNNVGAAVKMYMSSNGEFRTAESVPNAASLRFCFAYISV